MYLVKNYRTAAWFVHDRHHQTLYETVQTSPGCQSQQELEKIQFRTHSRRLILETISNGSNNKTWNAKAKPTLSQRVRHAVQHFKCHININVPVAGINISQLGILRQVLMAFLK